MVAFSKNQLPKIFAKLTPSGTPIIAIIVTMFGAIPGLLSEQFAPETIFKNLLGVAALQWLLFGLQFVFRNLTSVDSGISQEKQ